MSTNDLDFAQRVVKAAFLIRMIAILAALLEIARTPLSVATLMAILVLALTSFACLMSPRIMTIVIKHPLFTVLDVLLSLAVVAILGIDSPVVLATFSTALIIGILFNTKIAIVTLISLVAGIMTVVVLRNGGEIPPEFMARLGFPVLYVGLAAIGATVRRAHEHQTKVYSELSKLKEASIAADERARLSRELHDSVGKSLHGIAMAAETLPQWYDRDPASAGSRSLALAQNARTAVTEARALVTLLRSDSPNDPWQVALSRLCDAWQSESHIPCMLTTTADVELSLDARYEVIAIIGECLENVSRHANASLVNVSVEQVDEGLTRFQVRDNGAGFDLLPNGASPPGHLGLTGMRERAKLIGASLDIQSIRGSGTDVSIYYSGQPVDAR